MLMFIWAANHDGGPPRECEEWEWVTATFNGQHLGGGHIGPMPRKVRQCKKWSE